MSHNSKYYAKTLKTNPVKLRNIESFFKKIQQPTTNKSTKILPHTFSGLEEGDFTDLEVSIDICKESESTKPADLPSASSLPSVTSSSAVLSINPPSS